VVNDPSHFVFKGADMSDLDKQRWRELCQGAISERNPERFSKIIREANKFIEEKRTELRSKPPESTKT
jgi:hypothetical protein